MTFRKQPPAPVSQLIRDLAPEYDLFLSKVNAKSVREIASRLSRVMGRRYVTKRENGGVRVWRVR
jgi:hypothetical protein